MKSQSFFSSPLVLIIALMVFPFTALTAAPTLNCVQNPTPVCSVRPDTDSYDDAPYINKAIKWIEDQDDDGGVVYLEAGMYEIKTFIDLSANVALKGRNPENIPDQRSYPNPTLDITVIKYTGSPSPDNDNTMIWVCPQNVEIANLTLDGNPNPDKSRYSKVTNGIYANNNGGCEAANLKVRNVRIIRTARNGISCVGAEDPVIQKTTVTGLTGSSSSQDRLGIELQRCHGAVVEDNALDEWLSVTGVYGCAVRRNKILGRHGKDYDYALELVDSVYCVFSGNTVYPGAQSGLSISRHVADSTQYVYWYNNSINTAVTWGAQVQGLIEGDQSGTVRAQYFYQNKFSSAGDTPFQPVFPDSGHGFRFNEYCEHITLENNSVRYNKGIGIELSDNLDSLSFVRNNISYNTGPAITYSLLPANLEWKQNSVLGNGANSQPPSQGFRDNQKPTAKFTYSRTGPRKYRFKNQSSDPDGDHLTILWDLGYGPVVINVNTVEYTFSQTGQVYVSLVVWDTPEEKGKGRGHRATQLISVW